MNFKMNDGFKKIIKSKIDFGAPKNLLNKETLMQLYVVTHLEDVVDLEDLGDLGDAVDIGEDMAALSIVLNLMTMESCL